MKHHHEDKNDGKHLRREIEVMKASFKKNDLVRKVNELTKRVEALEDFIIKSSPMVSSPMSGDEVASVLRSMKGR